MVPSKLSCNLEAWFLAIYRVTVHAWFPASYRVTVDAWFPESYRVTLDAWFPASYRVTMSAISTLANNQLFHNVEWSLDIQTV